MRRTTGSVLNSDDRHETIFKTLPPPSRAAYGGAADPVSSAGLAAKCCQMSQVTPASGNLDFLDNTFSVFNVAR